MKMQEEEDVIITLSSSDEETEKPPIKKIKIDEKSINVQNTLKILKNLKEISAVPQGEEKPRDKDVNKENSLTIIIESDEVPSIEPHNNNVVVIDEDIAEESLQIADGDSSKSTIFLDDHSEESEDPSQTSKNAIILSEDDSASKIKENLQIDERPSTSKASETHKLFDKFLEICESAIRGSKYESKVFQKIPKIKTEFNNYDKLHKDYTMKKMLEEYIHTAKLSAPDAVICFQRIFSYLLEHTRGASIEVSEDDLPKIKKLEKTCERLLKKLKKLEESEVDFDEDTDSTYIQIDRYSERLNKVYNKYCKLLNRNPHTGRLLYEKINFVSSNYDEINRAITKSYKHNKFPTYYDIEKCIRECVSKNNLSLTENEIKEESKNCFTKLGNLIQLKRKQELYEQHCVFITLNEDPANKDAELKGKLQKSLDEGDKKLKDIIEKYVKLQENNVKPNLSDHSDSDDSHYNSNNSGSNSEG